MKMRIDNQAGIADIESLERLIGEPKILQEVIAWCGQHRFELCDVVTQDEFTHDVIIAMRDERYLVFDTT